MNRHVNRRRFLATSLCACCGGLTAAVTRSFAATSAETTGRFGTTGLPTALELGTEPMTRIAPTVWVAQIAPGVWMHSTTHPIGGAMYPANGLLLERGDTSLFIDTGWTPDQAETLVQWSRQTLKKPVALAVATHFHEDRTGGVDILKTLGIRTLAQPLTCTLAREHRTPAPEPISGFTGRRYAFDSDCELFFPGAGHTRDNVVAWVPSRKILFGGCFLKSSTSDGLGNTADADVPDWSGSVQRLAQQYPDRAITVPGHGTITGDAIGKTLALLAEPNKKS